jgi:hypothetical protein
VHRGHRPLYRRHARAFCLAVNHTQLIKGVAAFYPSLHVSDPSNSAHKPYLGFTAIPLPPNAASAESIASFCPADKQISEAPLARPGTQQPPPRNLWQPSILTEGRWLETVMPDGNVELIDPCQKLAEVGHRWPPTIFVQGDKDDLPVSGMAYVERAVTELKAAGAKRVAVEPEVGVSHVFDLLQTVMKGLDCLSQSV